VEINDNKLRKIYHQVLQVDIKFNIPFSFQKIKKISIKFQDYGTMLYEDLLEDVN
jgi:hypothetical protein